MPTFAGINHIALTVTDLDVSQRFYAEVLDFLPVLDVGYGRVLMHKGTGFTIAVVRHPESGSASFSELNSGLDHLGLTVADRDELVAWADRLAAAGVPFTPIQDLPLGHHLNFRDPDGIARELQAPSEAYAAALAQLQVRDVPDAEILELAATLVGPEFVARL